jgi:hypothetical protein
MGVSSWSSAGRPPKGSLSLSLSLSLHVRLLHLDINMHPFEHSDVIIK